MELEGEDEALLRGQASVLQVMFGFVDSVALKSAVELRIADIVHSSGGPITLSQIASGISHSPPPDIPYLGRIMRLLVPKKIFTVRHATDGRRDAVRTRPPTQMAAMLWDSEPNLVRPIQFENHPSQVASWHHISHNVKDGGLAFRKAHGCGPWDFASVNVENHKSFIDAMTCLGKDCDGGGSTSSQRWIWVYRIIGRRGRWGRW